MIAPSDNARDDHGGDRIPGVLSFTDCIEIRGATRADYELMLESDAHWEHFRMVVASAVLVTNDWRLGAYAIEDFLDWLRDKAREE